MDAISLGVEEEFLVVDAASGALVPRSHLLLPPAQEALGEEVAPELNLCQIEVGTPVCHDLGEVRKHLTRLRRELTRHAEELGLGIAATASHPFTPWQLQQVDLSNERYSRMDDVYQTVAREQVICGCHVHVGMPSRDLAVATMNRVRPWLPVLLALSANSPYWQDDDTGFNSYRLQVWQRWPTSGMPPELSGVRAYDELIAELELVDAIEDATFLYWYARPSARWPTLEFRIADVCMDVEETVAIAGLIRALAWQCSRDAQSGVHPALPRQEILEAATWRAARYGLDDKLVSPGNLLPRPAAEVVREMVAFVRDGLEAHGDYQEVSELVERILIRGNGATRQREAFARRRSSRDVIDHVLSETVPAHIVG